MWNVSPKKVLGRQIKTPEKISCRWLYVPMANNAMREQSTKNINPTVSLDYKKGGTEIESLLILPRATNAIELSILRRTEVRKWNSFLLNFCLNILIWMAFLSYKIRKGFFFGNYYVCDYRVIFAVLSHFALCVLQLMESVEIFNSNQFCINIKANLPYLTLKAYTSSIFSLQHICFISWIRLMCFCAHF